MSDMDQKRAFVESLYSGPRWKKRVRRMSDANVIAIYIREQEKKGEPKKHPPKKKESGEDGIPF